MVHRQNFVISVAPIAILFFGERFIDDGALIGEIVGAFSTSAYDLTEVTFIGLSRFAFVLMAVTNTVILVRAVIDRQYGEGIEIGAPIAFPSLWLYL